MNQPDFNYLIEKTGIQFPLIGFYDTPDVTVFEPLLVSKSCVFAYYKRWAKGESIVLSKDQYGCPGA